MKIQISAMAVVGALIGLTNLAPAAMAADSSCPVLDGGYLCNNYGNQSAWNFKMGTAGSATTYEIANSLDGSKVQLTADGTEQTVPSDSPATGAGNLTRKAECAHGQLFVREVQTAAFAPEMSLVKERTFVFEAKNSIAIIEASGAGDDILDQRRKAGDVITYHCKKR